MEEKVCFWLLFIRNDKNTQQMFQKRIDPLYIGPDKSFYNFKNCLDWVNRDLISKSSLLTLDSSGRLIVQYTLQTLYTPLKYKIKLQKRIDPLLLGSSRVSMFLKIDYVR